MIAGIVQNNAPSAAPMRSGRYYGQPTSIVLSTLALSQDTIYLVPLYVPTDTTLAGLACWPTIAVAINAHMGIYVDNNGVAGALVAGTDVTAALTAAAKNDFTFSSPVFITKGWYWIAIDVSGTCTLTAKSANDTSQVGNATMFTSGTGQGVKITASSVYGALPSTCPTITFTDGAANPYLTMKVN